ncbi:hypothetical protein PFISCL1PPCAC_12395, partial [Pristionchus fissidentatus]
DTNTWIRIRQSWSLEIPLEISRMDILVSGSRVYLIGSDVKSTYIENEAEERILRNVIVLEMNPTLVDHSMALLLRNENNREIMKRILP